MNNNYPTQEQQAASRIVELTREIAGSQGLAQLIRQAWTDASPEYRQKLADKLIESVQWDTHLIAEAMRPAIVEALQTSGMHARIVAKVKEVLPEIEAKVLVEVQNEIARAVKESVPKAIEEIHREQTRGRRY
jgi:hypothetical protein